MGTISLRIDDDIKERLERLTSEHGINQDELMREALLDMIEEIEDSFVVKERMSQPFTPIPNEEVWKRLGFED